MPTLTSCPVPATPGTGGVNIATYKDASGNVYQVVLPANPDGTIGPLSTIYSGSITSTTTKQPLPAQVLLGFLTVEALSTNTASLFVGNSSVTTSSGYELPPGASVSVPVANADELYVVGAGQLNYIAG